MSGSQAESIVGSITLSSINEHAASVAERERLAERLEDLMVRYRTVELSDVSGKTIQAVKHAGEDGEDPLVLVFTDDSYLGIKHDREFGLLLETSIPLEAVQRLGLMTPHDAEIFNETTGAVEATRMEAGRQRELRALIAHYGVERLREMLA